MLFYLFSFLIIAAALGVILSQNPVHSVLWLIFAFINSSGLFLLLNAEFLAMINIIVYVGAVAVLFLFVIMMLDIDFTAKRLKTPRSRQVIGLIMATFFSINIGIIIWQGSLLKNYWSDQHSWGDFPLKNFAHMTNTQSISKVLYTDFFVAFQIAGVVLLVAIIGAITLTMRKAGMTKKQNPQKQLDRKETVSLVKIVPNSTVKGIDYDS
jgi:NADH-quinone oxidoreductase subunit J